MDKEFSEVFQEEIVNEGKIEELGKQIAGIADKFKEGKDDVMTMADEMISQGNMPDPEAIKMLENEEADMVIHLIAKKMGVQWTKDNGYGEMRMKQNYPESTDMVMNLLGKKKVVVKEDKDLEKIVKELEGASKMHLAQSKRIQKHLDKMENGEVEVDEGNARVDRLKMIDKLKMSKLSPKQKKALEKEEVEEAKMKPDMLDTLKKKYESLRGKRLSLGQNMEIAKIVSGMSRDKEVLIQLVKADIPFISLNAATLLMDKHGMKAKDINLTNEGIDIQKADMKDVIKDFQSSDAPQFKGKSDKKKKEMAIAAKLSKEEVEMEEASKLPPHLAKFFDKKGDLKPEVAARIAKGREKLNIKDVTPKGYGPKEEENEDGDPVGKKKSKDKDYKTKDVINLKPTMESSMKKFKDIMTKLKEKRSSNEEGGLKEDSYAPWLDDEARDLEGRRWKKMSTKDRTKWLTQIKKMADKNDMSSAELNDKLSDYGLTKFDNEKVYDEAQKIKPKWKRMSTAQRTEWKDKMDDLAGKANTSDADVQSIMDDAGLKIKESVEEASGDKEAYQKFFNGALKKFGVKSPSQLKGDKKKEFFDYVDKNWTADHEEETKKEETMTKKSLKDAVSHMKEKKSKVQEALTIGGVEVGEQDFDKDFRLDHAAPNLGMTYKDYQVQVETDGMEGPYQIDGSAYFWDKAKAYWYSVEGDDYVDKKRNMELNFRYTKQGTAGGGLLHNRRM